MIKAICDKCGKESTLLYSEYGLKAPSGWSLENELTPLKRGYDSVSYTHLRAHET